MGTAQTSYYMELTTSFSREREREREQERDPNLKAENTQRERIP